MMPNFQQIMGQLTRSSNPKQMIMSMLSPEQSTMANSFMQGGMTEQKAQEIANACNRAGITKEQLTKLMRY